MKHPVCLALLLVTIAFFSGFAHATEATTSHQKPTVTASKPRLPDEKYKIYKDAMNKAREESKPTSDQIKTKKKELSALLSAEKFDKSAYLAKHTEIQNLIDKVSFAKASALATAAEKLSVDDRKILAERGSRKKERRSATGKRPNKDIIKSP